MFFSFSFKNRNDDLDFQINCYALSAEEGNNLETLELFCKMCDPHNKYDEIHPKEIIIRALSIIAK